nr:uncharacterized protein CTRU02_12732 [Colletotrichum truncatum]KAF6784203.1 hypothetical protein CTRU02_12732 [Colletotrichum truncatum]
MQKAGLITSFGAGIFTCVASVISVLRITSVAGIVLRLCTTSSIAPGPGRDASNWTKRLLQTTLRSHQPLGARRDLTYSMPPQSPTCPATPQRPMYTKLGPMPPLPSKRQRVAQKQNYNVANAYTHLELGIEKEAESDLHNDAARGAV